MKRSSVWCAWGRAAVVALTFVAVACEPAPHTATDPIAPGEWREFEGSWNASGSRRSIPLGEDRQGSIIHLRGTLLLHGPGRPGVGFRAELIALVDSATGMLGRGVWTDERGERVFSELTGEGTREKNRVTGTFLGGTGRYTGATGSYEFSWHSVVEAEDGAIQGRTEGLRGRVRFDSTAEGDTKP